MTTTIKKELLIKVSKSKFSAIFEQLEKPKTIEAFNKKEQEELILHASRFSTLNQQHTQGLITTETFNSEQNKIATSLINLFKDDKPVQDLTLVKNKHKKNLKNIENLLSTLITDVDKVFNTLHTRTPNYDWLENLTKKYTKVKNKWYERRFQVAIMALMKSGKSTLLNSWIGAEFLPSASMAETMRIIRIRHNSRRKIGVLFDKNKEVARGEEAVKNYIRNCNKLERNQNYQEKEKDELRLEYNLSSLKEKKLSGYGFDFLDTPGVNEHGIPTLQAKVERLVKNADVIIYLLDFTKLNTADENRMFERLKEWKSEILDQVKSRLFFVVNKIDEANRHDKEKNMTKEKIRYNVKHILHKSLSIDVNEENIILISAELALLGRLIKQENNITNGQLKDFKKIAFGEIGAEDATKEDCLRVVPRILEKSGFEELENKVLNTIHKKRSLILVSTVLDEVESILKQIINNIQVAIGTLQSEIEDIQKLKEKITISQKELKGIQKEIDVFKKKASKLINERFMEFEEGVDDLIKKAFLDTSGAKPRFPWLQIFTDFIGQTEFVIEDNDGQSIYDKIRTINNLVNGYLKNRFDNLWNELAEDQYIEFSKFSEEIEKRSEPLVRKIENEINKALNIKLHPSNIPLAKPTLKEFYQETHDSLVNIISAERKSNMNFLQSLFNKILRFFGLGREEIIYDEFRISSSDYKKMVLNMINPTLKKAKTKTNHFINKKYIDAIDSNAKNINNHANLYVSIIEKAINAKKKGIVNVDNRIHYMNKDIIDTNSQLRKIDDILNLL